MSTRNRRWTRVGNRIGVRMYRILGGRLSSGKKGVHVLMVTCGPSSGGSGSASWWEPRGTPRGQRSCWRALPRSSGTPAGPAG